MPDATIAAYRAASWSAADPPPDRHAPPPPADNAPSVTADAVLVTRPEAGAVVTARRLEALGLTPVLAPFLQIASRPVRLPRKPPAAVLVTSGAALASLPVLDAPLFAVGDVTAARARAAGWRRVESAAGTATDLAALVARRHLPGAGALLLASGEGQGGPLAEALRRGGFTVLRRVAYAATPVGTFPEAAAQALAGARLRAALFLSAETARTFHRLLPSPLAPALHEIDALAIGGPAAAALDAKLWRCVRIAAKPTLEGVLALL